MQFKIKYTIDPIKQSQTLCFGFMQCVCLNKHGVLVVPYGYSRGGSGRDLFPTTANSGGHCFEY